MPGAEFNKDMDSYMKQRSPRSDYSYLEAKAEMEEPTTMPEEQYEEDHEETPSTPSREGFFTRVRKFFGSDDEQPPAPMDEPAPEPDVHEACREDIKTIGKIALDILRALPDKELVGFKNSDQYAQLKRILGKHNLIKSE